MLDTKLLAYDYYMGFDVGKRSHHVVVIRGADQATVLDEQVAQDEASIAAAVSGFAAMGRVLASVDQSGSIGRLVTATAAAAGADVGFLTPSDFHHFAEGYSEVKTDSVDAFEICDLSMRMTHLLYAVGEASSALEELSMLCTRRSDLVAENTREKNRVRALLVSVHPAFERVFGREEMDMAPYLGILARYGGPLGIGRAGRKRVLAFVAGLPYYRAKAGPIVERVFAAAAEQKAVLAGAQAAERIIRSAAKGIVGRSGEVAALDREIAAIYGSFSESAILSSMPGIGGVLGPVILSEIGSIGRFEDAGHLAAYGGVAPSRRQSGESRGSAKKKRGCNRRLKGAFCYSAWIAVGCDPAAAAYYRKKRDEGKNHDQALLALARKRVSIIYAMLTTGSPYDPAMQGH
ncbi:MAG: IS110 family transposase [Coriobacteriia bacterium]|nr:IS110 family transposase [Coriobacteriia bacterium]